MADHAEFIRSLYAAFGRGDVATILDNLDPAIEWTSNVDPAKMPWGGKRTGRNGALSFFQALGESLDFEVLEPGEFFVATDAVTVLGRTRARNKHGGHGVFDCAWVHLFTIGDGKVPRFMEFYDTAAMQAAMAI